MTDSANFQVKLIQRPVGLPTPADFTFETAPAPTPAEGEVLVQTLYVSLDPAMRGWMSEAKSYLPPVQLGDVMRALAASRVIESRNPRFSPGDLVTGATGLQVYAAVPAAQLTKLPITSEAELPRYLGALGMPGMTAYFGLLEVGAMKAGDTVVVSGAAGAVGSVVGQIARIKGGRAVGIAGGAEKCKFVVEELGFDDCIDYREGPIGKRLRAACP
ncbi:MAG: NADP-dependent oxidoreductase, partial [Caulobacteraceae bacterium]